MSQPTATTAVCAARGVFGRWFIVLATDRQNAWTGTRWTRHLQGISPDFQLCNFETRGEAVSYANRLGFTVLEEAA